MTNLQSVACAVTMVRGDHFFLQKWVDYYGARFGRKACHVISHGFDPEIQRIAEGCNITVIPFEENPGFDVIRWRMLNSIVQGLLNYYRHVIVGDVDELIVIDPNRADDLLDFLANTRGGRVLTPIGLEVVHLPNEETQSIEKAVLGPRRFVRHKADYSKPCVVSAKVKLARGCHFTKYNQFRGPKGLYLFHLKFCDLGQYSAAMDRRNELTKDTGTSFRDASIGRHWFAEFRGDDLEIFSEFETLERKPFKMEPIRQRMEATFEPRGESGFYQSSREEEEGLFEIPERFFGIF